jgi:hypothetical protein
LAVSIGDRCSIVLDAMTNEIHNGVNVMARYDGSSSKTIVRAPSKTDIDIPATRK